MKGFQVWLYKPVYVFYNNRHPQHDSYGSMLSRGEKPAIKISVCKYVGDFSIIMHKICINTSLITVEDKWVAQVIVFS